jgi:hypothetical protein
LGRWLMSYHHVGEIAMATMVRSDK